MPADRRDRDRAAPRTRNRNHSFFAVRINQRDVFDRDDVLDHLSRRFVAYACQLEQGANGQRHYQLVVKTLPKKTRKRMVDEWCTAFPHLRGFVRGDDTGGSRADGAEWYCEPQVMRGGDRFGYAIKPDTRLAGPWTKNVTLPAAPVQVLDPNAMHMWQRALVVTLDAEPNDRTIHWYWEATGGSGKSALCKYLCHSKDALLCSGRANDMKYLLVQYHKRKKVYPRIILFDVPRTNAKYIDYQGLEEIKNGCFASTKYECAMVIMPSPHVVVFANAAPDETKLSADRWDVTEVVSNDEHDTELQEDA